MNSTEKYQPPSASPPQETVVGALLQCPGFATLLLNSDGVIHWASSAAEALLSDGTRPIVGQTAGAVLLDALDEDDKPSRAGTLLTAAAAGHQEFANATIGVIQKGITTWLEIRAIPLAGGGLTVLMLEVTDRIEAERVRLRDVARNDHSQHLQSLGDMAAGIGDDFNNLLLNILGQTALMLMDLPAESQWREPLQRIETSALQAGELSNQMLAWAGRISPVSERLNLTVLIERMDYLLRAALPPGVVLHRNCDPRIPDIEADAVQLRQLILGLLSNACDAMEDQRGVITITTGCMRVDESYLKETLAAGGIRPGRFVSLEIADNGAGISEEVQSRVFDPFFTTKRSGRGLGLPAALGIVRGHHGAVRLDSAVGRGTTLTILLPAVAPLADEPRASTENQVRLQAAGGASATVLVVEEDDNVRQIAGRILLRFGWQVSLASHGSEALDQLRSTPSIRIALMDLALPDFTPSELSRAMRQISPELRIVASSGYLDRELVMQLQHNGDADGYIQKPYTPIGLMARIREVAGR